MNVRKKLIVIGNGMVGHRFCEKMAARKATDHFEILVFGDEPRPAYDRVHLSEFFQTGSADSLSLASHEWYTTHGMELRTGTRIARIDPQTRQVFDAGGQAFAYEVLVLATGSRPFVPPLPGAERTGVFVYRTIEDLVAIREYAGRSRTAAVIGGGLLGLEAAKAALDLGLVTSVVEFAPRLLPRQLDDAGAALLRERIEELGVRVVTGALTEGISGNGHATGLALKDGAEIPADLVIISAGIRPNDEIARAAGLNIAERGGVVVDEGLCTSDPAIFAIGEVASARGMIYGLVAPGYEMAEVLAANLAGEEREFVGGDLSTRLKLIGVDVASFGDAFGETVGAKPVQYLDAKTRVYKKLVLSADGKKLIGGILVGDAAEYGRLTQIMEAGVVLPAETGALLFAGAGQSAVALELPDSAQVCKCNAVDRGAILAAVRGGVEDLGELKRCTNAGTGCGGCAPLLAEMLHGEMARQGRQMNRDLCEHFAFSRQELFTIIKIKGLRTFADAIRTVGTGTGCEICKPAVASILASLWNDLVVRPDHAVIQDTNDRFLANIQRGGTYSVVPRVPGGEITPEQLIRIGEVARKYDLYCKITGGQRIDLFGARVDQLPSIWEELIEVGLESGHAYGKALRTVKSCVGSTWCRYGVQDSTSMAVRLEQRYRGLRSPHKIKSAVSGCIRECAEAQSKDFGVIATEKGWNLYVCGNGGARPQHAELLASDLNDETLIRYIDRFLMYYVRTADRLERTSTWFNKLEGGLDHLRRVVIEDALGICAELEEEMERHVATYRCEWTEVVKNPELRLRFRHFANSDEPDDGIRFDRQRGQKVPAVGK